MNIAASFGRCLGTSCSCPHTVIRPKAWWAACAKTHRPGDNPLLPFFTNPLSTCFYIGSAPVRFSTWKFIFQSAAILRNTLSQTRISFAPFPAKKDQCTPLRIPNHPHQYPHTCKPGGPGFAYNPRGYSVGNLFPGSPCSDSGTERKYWCTCRMPPVLHPANDKMSRWEPVSGISSGTFQHGVRAPLTQQEASYRLPNIFGSVRT